MMIQPQQKWLSHCLLIIIVGLIGMPLYFALVAASHDNSTLMGGHFPLFPGHHLWENLSRVLSAKGKAAIGASVPLMMLNSFIMAMLIALGKTLLSLLSAFALVYYEFPGRKLFFAMIFATLLLPVEVRILPTFQVAARFDLLNSYAGLTLPLLASATATFLFRQYFMTIPTALIDAAKCDGAGPWRILWQIVFPLSRSNLAAIFVIMFIYGWDQYLWPLVITTDATMSTIVMGMQRLASVADRIPAWNEIMMLALLALLPPALVIMVMQKLIVKGLIQIEK